MLDAYILNFVADDVVKFPMIGKVCEYSRSIPIWEHMSQFLRIFGRYYGNLCDLVDAELPFAEKVFPIPWPDELEGLVTLMAVSFEMGYLWIVIMSSLWAVSVVFCPFFGFPCLGWSSMIYAPTTGQHGNPEIPKLSFHEFSGTNRIS